MKARWTKWQGGHGAVHAYSLELGNLLNARVQQKLDTRQWEVRLNQAHLGAYDSQEDAFRRAEEGIMDYASQFIEDWTIWMASKRVGCADAKGLVIAAHCSRSSGFTRRTFAKRSTTSSVGLRSPRSICPT